jgi:23S rRNA (adenine2503-C2)-methyltransferase
VNPLNLAPVDAAAELGRWLAARGEAAYRLRQMVPRLWQRPVGGWRDATDLPGPLARALEETFPLPRLQRLRQQTSRDGTVKLLWGLPDGEAIESVWIPEGKRRTLCISSQAGCAFGCVFCATGRMGFRRHLEPWEIAGQVREMLLDQAFGKPTNVVFMGMGEPLHNWRAVDTALTILNAPQGVGLGARHLTVSTVGVLPNLARLAARPEQFRLAVSLHAATSERRRALMPVERKYPLPDLVAALRAFRRRITFEYVLIAGRNDAPEDAAALAGLAQPLGALVNLLPLHPGGAPGLVAAAPADMTRFASLVRAGGVSVSVRRSRGLDISAACGQLRVETERGSEIASREDAHIEQQTGIGPDQHTPQAERAAHP